MTFGRQHSALYLYDDIIYKDTKCLAIHVILYKKKQHTNTMMPNITNRY
jgi:hypothetical protein